MEVAMIFLSPLIQSAYDKLLVPELIGFAGRERLADAIDKLKKTLKDINDVLADAEDKQVSQKTVKEWLQELHHLAYDADDVVDNFATEALRKKLKGDPEASTSKVRRLIPPCCTSFRPRTVALNSSIRSRINDITNKLQEIAKRRSELGLVLESQVGQSRQMSTDVWQGRTTTSLMNEPSVYGRGDDKNQIVDQLLSHDAPDENKVEVISIVGMGGSGKTTLAQYVYQDSRVVNHFPLKAWFCVSDQFDVTRLTKQVLESFTRKLCNLGALNELQNELSDTLKDKRFLLVLDDIWDHSYDAWISLRIPFGVGANGSKVIVTTRDSKIASQVRSVKQHYLQNLSDDDCWNIFAQHAFTSIENRKIGERECEELCTKIVPKCKGLPLAARALGGLLGSIQNKSQWEEVLQSDVWSEEGSILPILKLSYYCLPTPLKRCFGYCAIIPKDYEFQEEELVFLWMAQGLLQVDPQGRKRKEDLGREYFQNLVSRSLFQTSTRDNSKFIMHDLVNDLVVTIAGEMCIKLENPTEGGGEKMIFTRARHSSYLASNYDGLKKFEVLKEATCLRTFLQFVQPGSHTCSTTGYLFRDLLPKLKCLRELRLENSYVYEVPESIEGLKHLRYLNLSRTYIRRLPDSVVTLYNLEVLLLRFCCNLKTLPPNMESLVNLRHFDITGVNILSSEEMPLHISKLKNLQTLSNFMVGKRSGNRIGELRNLLDIRGAIFISRLENVTDAQEAMEANLNSKHGLKELHLEWGISPSPENAGVDRDVLEMLKPDVLLEKLTISGYLSTTFPNWVGMASFSKIVSMRLVNCQHCTSLPPLGQLTSLQDLYVEGMSGVKYVGCEFNGQGCAKPFPSLETLTFVDMLEWKEWSIGIDNEDQSYNLLSKLSIRNCPKLVGGLPADLPQIKSLEIKDCPQLVVDVSGLVLPSLTTLSMDGVQLPGLPALLKMRNVPESGSLLTLDIDNVSVPDSLVLCDSSATDELLLGNLMSKHLHSITSLKIDSLEKLTFLTTWCTGGLTGLKELVIREGKELVTLWKNKVRLQECLPSLLQLEISNCPKLNCLLEEEEETGGGGEGGGKQQQDEGLPWLMRLERLQIDECPSLKKLPRGLHALAYLAELRIEGCPSLVSFPETGLPSMLRKLEISSCSALQSLPELMTLTNLQELKVWSCESLRHLSSRGGLSSTLKEIWIYNCAKLEAILGEEGMKINCPSLESFSIGKCDNLRSLPDALDSNLRKLNQLVIRDCDNLESLPEGWFHHPTANLKGLSICGCEKLEALPLGVHHQFTSLESLWLYRCHAGIVSCFLKEGSTEFLTNLREFEIWNISGDQVPSRSEWALHRLTSLQKLTLVGLPDMVSFPEDGMLLPTASLKNLRIGEMPDLERISSGGFQNLTSLETLDIWDCPRLACFPKEGLPPKLLNLKVYNCPELASFPEQGLPPSLLTLEINRCPKLKEQCEKGRGRYWHNIAYIPYVEIDFKEVEV